jgi:hypothetical protein
VSAEQPRFGADPKPYYLALAALVLLEFVRRAFMGYVPDDFTAYLSAADVFWGGGNPYADFEQAQRYAGKPFTYFPGTLYLLVWMAWVPTAVAVAADFVARIVVLAVALRWIGKRILPNVSTHWVYMIAVLCQPLMIDVLFGNLVSYLFGAWVCCVYLSEREPTVRRLAAAAACGVVFSFKPFWYPAAAYCFFVHRNWRGFAALTIGGGSIAILSLRHIGWLDSFVAHTSAMREFYISVDLLQLAPTLYPVASVGWLVLAFHVWRRVAPDESWLFGATSIWTFPRLATYSYVLALPLVFYCIRRFGLARGLLLGSIIIGPVPWFLRVAPGWPVGRLENWGQFVWIFLLSAVIYVSLIRASSSAPESP